MDPLAQLKNIHLPEQVHNYPIAYGWWFVLAAFIFTLILLIKKYKNHRKNCQAKNQALKHLNNPSLTTAQIISTVKWAALQYYPRQEVASLTNQALQKFLSEQLPVKHHQQFNVLMNPTWKLRYQRDEQTGDNQPLNQAATLWIKHALPPKKKMTTMNESRKNVAQILNQGEQL